MSIINKNTIELCSAIRSDDIDLVEQILNTKVININYADSNGDTPLINAIMHWHLSFVKKLIEHPDIDVNATNVNPGMRDLTPLMWAILWTDDDDVESYVKTLLEVPSLQIGKTCDNGCTALHYAAQSNSVSILKLICNDGRCKIGLVNKKDNHGYTALMTAVVMGHVDIVKELDMEGSDFHIKHMNGRSLIQMARRRNNAELVEYLKNRPNVDTLMVICGVNISRYLNTIDDVESLQIPLILKQFLSRFVN